MSGLVPAGQAHKARFKAGDRVLVRAEHPPGHIRTPYYIRGVVGEIEQFGGAYPNPEELALQRDGLPAQPLYRVHFRQRDVWPDYAGSDKDTIILDLFQHWLEPVQGGDNVSK
jgi:nitrile hydratase